MGNLDIYNALRTPPDGAKKEIRGGRLKGMTDINPMWRIKALTEQFGPCGIGWKYEITQKEIAPGANDEMAAFVDINLYIKANGAWSDPIPGTGGAAFVSREKSGLYTSDECFKMALTDAISVACKALGAAADVYWDKDRTKYDKPEVEDKPGIRTPPDGDTPVYCEECGSRIDDYFDGRDTIPAATLAKRSRDKYGKVFCIKCGKKAKV